MDSEYRLTPTRSSRKLAAYDFIRARLFERGVSPSITEVSEAVGTSRSNACEIINALVREHLFLRIPGRKGGLRLPEAKEQAIANLRALGWRVNEDAMVAIYELGTKSELHVPIELDHIPGSTIGGDPLGRDAGASQSDAGDRRPVPPPGALRARRGRRRAASAAAGQQGELVDQGPAAA